MNIYYIHRFLNHYVIMLVNCIILYEYPSFIITSYYLLFFFILSFFLFIIHGFINSSFSRYTHNVFRCGHRFDIFWQQHVHDRMRACAMNRFTSFLRPSNQKLYIHTFTYYKYQQLVDQLKFKFNFYRRTKQFPHPHPHPPPPTDSRFNYTYMYSNII